MFSLNPSTNTFMNKILFTTALCLSLNLLSQRIITDKDYKILNACNKNSYTYAEKLYKKVTEDADRNQKYVDEEEFYDIICDSKCSLYTPIILKYWSDRRFISKESFEKYFVKRPENYPTFLKGLFVNLPYNDPYDNLPYEALMEYVYRISPADFDRHMDSLLTTDDLYGAKFVEMMTFLRDKKLTESYKKTLFSYVEKCTPQQKNIFKMHRIIFDLLQNTEDKQAVLRLLEKTQDCWESIEENNRLSFYGLLWNYKLDYQTKNPYFRLNKYFNTLFNFEPYLSDKQKNKIVGKNPTVLDGNMNKLQYKEGELIDRMNEIAKDSQIYYIYVADQKATAEIKKLYGIENPDGIIIYSSSPYTKE